MKNSAKAVENIVKNLHHNNAVMAEYGIDLRVLTEAVRNFDNLPEVNDLSAPTSEMEGSKNCICRVGSSLVLLEVSRGASTPNLNII